MCGRISTAGLSADSLRAHFDIDGPFPFTLSYNVAPTLQVPAIVEEGNHRKLEAFRWGLIPHWARDKEIKASTFNACAETLTQKPFFRESIKSRRCLVLASGFYEWHRQAGRKQPYYICRADQRPLAFAGLWDLWEDPDSGEAIESCAIITTAATQPLKEIHERMPVVLESDRYEIWLDPEFNDTDVLQNMLVPAKDDVLAIYPVSTYVNNARNDGEVCIERL